MFLPSWGGCVLLHAYSFGCWKWAMRMDYIFRVHFIALAWILQHSIVKEHWSHEERAVFCSTQHFFFWAIHFGGKWFKYYSTVLLYHRVGWFSSSMTWELKSCGHVYVPILIWVERTSIHVSWCGGGCCMCYCFGDQWIALPGLGFSWILWSKVSPLNFRPL